MTLLIYTAVPKGQVPVSDPPKQQEANIDHSVQDRMFRNAGDCLNVAEQWERAGAALHILELGGNAIDTTSAAGRRTGDP